jgi:hypothetical protein
MLGSQIFDYWQESMGFKIEHYADGDFVNVDTLPGRETTCPLSIWGLNSQNILGTIRQLVPFQMPSKYVFPWLYAPVIRYL